MLREWCVETNRARAAPLLDVGELFARRTLANIRGCDKSGVCLRKPDWGERREARKGLGWLF